MTDDDTPKVHDDGGFDSVEAALRGELEASGPPPVRFPVDLGPFVLDEKLGEGGMGTVYHGVHRETDVDVAVKVIRRSLGEEASKQFHREVQAHAGLVHPGVVYLFEYGDISETAATESGGALTVGNPFVAMELADSGTVRDILPLSSWHDVRDLLVGVLDALAHAHARGVVHRDLKPENFLVFQHDDRPRVKLADFGIAHALDDESDRTTDKLASASGTPIYMAPEQSHGRWREYGPWTDLYALGCIAWELVSGHPPFTGDSMLEVMSKHDSARRPALEPRFAIPAGLEDWIHRAMAIDTSARFRRAADALRALDSLEPTQSDLVSERPDPDEELQARLAPTLAPSRRDAGNIDTQVDPSAPTALGALAETVDAEPDHHPKPREDEPVPRPDDPYRIPVPDTWEVDRADDLPSHLVGTGLGLLGLRETPFVDRDPERDRIWQALREVQQTGEPRSVLVIGDSGTGKSRLVEWLATRAHELGVANILRAVHTAGGNAPTEGIPGMVRRAARAHKLDRGELYQHLQRRLPPLDDGAFDPESDARALTELVYPTDDNQSIDGPRYRFSDAGQKRALVARFIRRYSLRRPALVWFDDGQWGDLAMGATRHVLETTLEKTPALFIVTLRSDVLSEEKALREDVENLAEHHACMRIRLDTLPARDHRRFIERMLPLESELASRLAERTEGNPLFATQLLRDQVEAGRLEAGENGFCLPENESLQLPENIHELWLRRLRRAVDRDCADEPHAVWRAIEMAAALGRQVDASEWKALCERLGLNDPAEVTGALVERGLAERGDQGWAFTHGLLVDSIERRARDHQRWQSHHVRCAEFLADLYPDRSGQTAARRADHWTEAGRLRQALDPLLEAYEHSDTSGESLEERKAFLARRRRLLDRLEIPDDDPLSIENEIEFARTSLHLGTPPEEVLTSLEHARNWAERSEDPHMLARAFRAIAGCQQRMGDLDDARDAARRATDWARREGDESELIDSLISRGWTEYHRGNVDEAEKHADEAHRLAIRNGYRHKELASRGQLAFVALSGGDEQLAANRFEESLQASRAVGNPSWEAECLNGLGEIARFRGDADEARDRYRESKKLYRKLNWPEHVAVAQLNLALVELLDGRFEIASRLLAESERRLDEHARKSEKIHLLRLAHLTDAAGRENWPRFDELFSFYADGWPDDARRIQDHPWLLELAGDYAAERAKPQRARQTWALAAELSESLGDEETTERLTHKIDS